MPREGLSSVLKMIIIADRQTSLPFVGIGVDAVVDKEIEEVKRTLRKLFKEEKYAIILVAQSLAAKCLDLIEALSEQKLYPLITIIPDSRGKVSGIAEQRLRNLIRKAVGMELPGGE